MLLQNLLNEFAEMIFSDYHAPELVKPASNILVHRNNTTATLVKTLEEVYPLITKLIGPDCFRVTAENYITQYPSRSSNLHDYGAYFSNFLIEYEPVEDLLYLPEVAKFEWICHTLYFAADQAPLDMTTLQNVPPGQFERLHFILHPASRVVKFQYPILNIIDICNETTEEPINIANGGVSLLIIRRELEIALVTLTSAEYVFLNALQDNHSLSIAVKAAINMDADFNLRDKLLGWVKDMTIVDISISS